MGEITIPAPLSEPAEPQRRRTFGQVVGRLFKTEGAIAWYVGLAISLVFNFKVVLNPRSQITGDLGDPLLQAWQMAWQHRFLTGGGDLWTGNQFYPAADNLAFSDSLLGYLPLSLFGNGPGAAILRYNIAFVFAFALAFAGCYLLARQLGSNWQGAALAGVVLAWAPWKLSHMHHLNVLSVGGIALALWAIARGHGYSLRERGPLRPWWAFAGWVIAAWQVMIGFAIGLSFVYVMAGVGLAVVIFVARRRLGYRMIAANAWGVVVFLGVTLLMVVPYFRVLDEYGFKRTWREVQIFSPVVDSLWTAPRENWLWFGSIFNDYSAIPKDGHFEKLLFPGLIVVLLAVVGLFVSAWRVKARIMLAAVAATAVVLALGAGFLDGAVYKWLWDHAPGWDAMRTPGRLILWAILPLTLLAAGAVTKFGSLLYGRTQIAVRVVAGILLVPALIALLEGIPRWAHVEIEKPPADLQRVFAQTQDPMVMLPMDLYSEFAYLLWSTESFPKMANGNSGNIPPQYHEIFNATQSFPDQRSIAVLKRYGIRKVVIVKSRPGGAELATRGVGGLPLDRVESADVVEFTITG